MLDGVQAVHKTCKDCGKPFSISGKELTWLKDNGLKPFERCKECRKKRRMKNAE